MTTVNLGGLGSLLSLKQDMLLQITSLALSSRSSIGLTK